MPSPDDIGAAPGGLQDERDQWLAFAKSEFWQLVEAFDTERAELEAQIRVVETQLEDVTERLEFQEVGLVRAGDHPTATSVAFKEAVGTAVNAAKRWPNGKMPFLAPRAGL